ncbi:MAG: type III-A CRISPR-associated protein Csm2 [Christensenellales bacterium]
MENGYNNNVRNSNWGKQNNINNGWNKNISNFNRNNAKNEIEPRIEADEAFFEKITINYADEAENVIRELKENGKLLTKSSIRNILELINTVREEVALYSVENAKKDDEKDILPKSIEYDIQYILLKLYYIYGKSDKDKDGVQSFIKFSKLRELVLCIGNSKHKFEIFARYVEALVAFHKFYGGKD